MSIDSKHALIAPIVSRPATLLLSIVIPFVIVLLWLPTAIPIGPMYWDTYIYFDAAQRIMTGQIPNVDFLTPVGPLGYYLFAWGLQIFPQAQPLLLAQWCLMAVTIPLMLLAMSDVAQRSRALTLALLVPFLVFSLSPANVNVYHPFPSLDGFGIYNRHSVILLYVLASGILFLRDGRKLAFFLAATMLALFLTKITGFLVGGLIGLLALLAGRVSVRNGIIAAVLFAAPLAVIEIWSGMVSAYIFDIEQLAGMNSDSLLPRFLTVASADLDILLPAGLLLILLWWTSRRQPRQSRSFFDRDFWWLLVALVAGVVFETQNTGSQEFIFLWPVILMIYERVKASEHAAKMLFLILAAFCVIPTFTKVVHKTLRAIAVAPTYVQLQAPSTKTMQQVLSRPDIIARAKLLEKHYETFAATYANLSANGQLPSWQYYSELDFQLFWIIDVNSGVEAIRKFEASNGVRLDSLMSLDFTNPFPWLLDRNATKHIQIGADPHRTVPDMADDTRKAIEATAGILRPKCPLTTGRRLLEANYRDALANRKVIQIHPCWDLLVRPDILLSAK